MGSRKYSGRCFEDFRVGDVFQHTLGRTITQTDNAWFSLLTLNSNPMHFDAHYASGTEFGRTLVNSALTLALVTGLSVTDMSQNAVNLGWNRVRVPRPLFEGDTVYATSTVTSTRPSRSRVGQGIVVFETIGVNQEGLSVIEFERTILVYRRDHVPTASETVRRRP